MTLIRIVLLSNGCAVITLFKIYPKRVMTDSFTFECHYSLLDHVKMKLLSWLSFGVRSFTSVQLWLSFGTTHNPSVHHYSLSAHASLSAPESNGPTLFKLWRQVANWPLQATHDCIVAYLLHGPKIKGRTKVTAALKLKANQRPSG